MLKFSVQSDNKTYSGIILSQSDDLYKLGLDKLKDMYQDKATVSQISKDNVIRTNLINQFKVSGDSIVIYVEGGDIAELIID